jgi:hypothetical protein
MRYGMKLLKKILQFSGRVLIAFMFAVCMVIGVVPFIPKRKEEFAIEIKMEDVEKEIENSASSYEPKKASY